MVTLLAQALMAVLSTSDDEEDKDMAVAAMLKIVSVVWAATCFAWAAPHQPPDPHPA